MDLKEACVVLEIEIEQKQDLSMMLNVKRQMNGACAEWLQD
tara:strand:- start:111 stop:233 length:123 start_codon:yes stop_codon:yes gene_type:complete